MLTALGDIIFTVSMILVCEGCIMGIIAIMGIIYKKRIVILISFTIMIINIIVLEYIRYSLKLLQ